MISDNFPTCLNIVLGYEGGYVNDPVDPGGATAYGITQAVYDAWRRGRNSFLRKVSVIQPSEVAEIYRAQYWNAARCGDLYPGLDLTLFDIAVNSGPIVAIKFLQQALGVAIDGQFGLLTANALRNVANHADLIKTICDRRLSYWHSLTTWWRFGKGWTRRGQGIAAKALAMNKANP